MSIVLRTDSSEFSFEVFRNASVAFGVFDGVHKGHQYLLKCTQDAAQHRGGKSIVLTFDKDPDEVFHPQRLKKLMSNEVRLSTLAKSGVDTVVVLPFVENLYALSPQEFLRETFCCVAPESIQVGENLHFGAGAAGSIADLSQWAKAHQVQLVVHRLMYEEGKPISSTRIRLLLEQGRVEEAGTLLGRPYSMTGIVRLGRGDGERFGFRTANLVLPHQLLSLANGVYAGRVSIEGLWYKAAVNVGIPPTFAEKSDATVEVHLLDFEGDLYGKPLTVEFLAWLREERKFASFEELIATVQENIQWVRDNVELPTRS